MKQQVVGVGFDADRKRFMQLEGGDRVYLSSQEYKKVKQKLSGKQKYYHEVNLKEVAE